MASAAQTDVFAVDMGMVQDVPGTIRLKNAYGTGNMVKGPAMTRSQAEVAVRAGIGLVGQMKKKGYCLIATGEMGIGYTTASTAPACVLLRFKPKDIVGRGAGLSDVDLMRKRYAIERALELSKPDACDPMDVLSKVGGFEIAGMVGAFLGGMKHRVPIIIDGVISSVAALVAARICPACREYMLPSHMSREVAMKRIMQELSLEPIIHADMALGEGTGAVMLFPLLDMVYRVYTGEHTFDSLGMEAYSPKGEGT